jgi:hypothetical protein
MGNVLILTFSVTVDIDECNGDTWPCHVNATCANDIGNFTCTCKDGFEGNRTHCDGQY